MMLPAINPTETSAIFEPFHSSNCVPDINKVGQSPDFEALKLQNIRLGKSVAKLKSLLVPDRPFHDFRALRSEDRLILGRSETPYNEL